MSMHLTHQQSVHCESLLIPVFALHSNLLPKHLFSSTSFSSSLLLQSLHPFHKLGNYVSTNFTINLTQSSVEIGLSFALAFSFRLFDINIEYTHMPWIILAKPNFGRPEHNLFELAIQCQCKCNRNSSQMFILHFPFVCRFYYDF